MCTCVMVPLVDSKVMVTSDGDDCRGGDGRVSVCGDVRHRRVTQELHDHTHVIGGRTEHHWGLKQERIVIIQTGAINDLIVAGILIYFPFYP